MEISVHPRGMHPTDFGARRGGRNKQWVAPGLEQPSRSANSTPGHSDAERRDRGRGRGRGHAHSQGTNGFHSNNTSRTSTPIVTVQDDPVLETAEEREKFYQELVKQREVERKTAIAEGKMDDPLVPKRLEDAISIVGTCMDMCPRFERYRRERENNLFEWETIPGTKRIDHKRAVKMYERAAGDKTIPSDLRPPLVLKKTLDYLFHDLLPRGGFSPTFNFIRDRSRAVRNDFTMQHITSPLAMECHERCARFHILALYLERDREGFSVALEEQQLMNTLQSLKEFYNDQRGTYESPAELEMRIYHRLIHIRDQVERPEPVPLSQHVAEHPMYKLTTAFRAHVQEQSKPITKSSKLRVGAEGMRIFGELAQEMMGAGGGGKGMVFLVACILERLFGKGTVQGIDDIRGGASWGDIIDGVTGDQPAVEETQAHIEEVEDDELTEQDDIDLGEMDELQDDNLDMTARPAPLQPSATGWLAQNLGPTPAAAFGPSTDVPAPAISSNAFSNLGAAAPTKSVFASTSAFPRKSVFGNAAANPFASSPTAANSTPPAAANVFTQPAFPSSAPADPPAQSTTPFLAPTPSAPANGLAVPPRVQNNPFLPSNSPSPLSLAPPLGSTTPAPAPSNIFAPAPAKPAAVDLGAKDKLKAVPWNGTFTAPSALNPKAAEFQPSSAPAPPQPQPTKPVFGVAPIPFYNGFPTSAPSSSTSLGTPPAAAPTPVQKGTPPLAKIDTSPPSLTVPGDNAPGPSTPLTPGNPPPLGRVQPISLPSTPTLPSATPSSLAVLPSPMHPQPTKPLNPLLGLLKDSIQTTNLGVSASGSGGGSGMLSPLVIASPSIPPLRHSFSPVKPSVVGELNASPVRLNGDIKGKGKERAVEMTVERDLEAMAHAFERRGLVVRRCLALWRKRTTDRAEWAEACRRSEQYSEKVRREREKGKERSALKRTSPNGKGEESGSKRLKLLENENGEEDEELSMVVDSTPSSAKKRASLRRRKYEPPRTDEDLARRFEENKEEHTRRWAQGSFLHIVRTLVKSKSKAARSSSAVFWRLWLSLNGESDATAIWLECKFDVAGSGGQWETSNVFSIPVVSNSPSEPNPERFPGLIVFECTPLEGVEDELERKYRILDDCSRLREVIQALPDKRHFVPSLLLFVWIANEASSSSDSRALPRDLEDMINKLIADSVIGGFQVFPVTATTTELDPKFQAALNALDVDVEGRLVQSLTLKDVFKLFDTALNTFISDWLENCASSGDFDWSLYCRLLDAAVSVLNKTALLSIDLVSLDSEEEPVLPPFRPDWNGMRDSESTFEAVISWLANPQLDSLAANIVATDLQSHRDMGREFPSSAFFDHLRGLALYHTELGLEKGRSFFVSTKDIAPALDKHNAAIELHRTALIQAHRMSIRRSPRRRSRSLSEDTDFTSPSFFKRQRISSSNLGTSGPITPSSSPPPVNGRMTPSPSASTVSLASTTAPTVTTAMLRALTKDMRSRYGKKR